MTRVVVTGAGCVTPIGCSLSTFQRSLFDGLSGISPLQNVAPGDLRFTTAATVKDFVPADWCTAQQLQIAERTAQFALASARQAITSSRLLERYSGENIAVVFGCSTGGRTAEEPETAKLYTKGGRVHPLTVPRTMASAGTSLTCMEYGITGPAYTVSTACASASHAIGQAFHMVRSGLVEAALTGGHEAPLTYGFLKSWDSLHVVSPDRCRPFSRNRNGMTLGEGAAILVLESFPGALARGAVPLGEIVGFGMSSDSAHMTQPSAAGQAAAIRRALHDAHASPTEVAYVNAHGTGTEANDRVEAEALHLVFGERADTLSVSSTKSLHGHAMGASGALEALATLLALQSGIAPSAVGPEPPDLTLRLGGWLQENRKLEGDLALSNSFAFGGLNAVLALRRYPSERGDGSWLNR